MEQPARFERWTLLYEPDANRQPCPALPAAVNRWLAPLAANSEFRVERVNGFELSTVWLASSSGMPESKGFPHFPKLLLVRGPRSLLLFVCQAAPEPERSASRQLAVRYLSAFLFTLKYIGLGLAQDSDLWVKNRLRIVLAAILPSDRPHCSALQLSKSNAGCDSKPPATSNFYRPIPRSMMCPPRGRLLQTFVCLVSRCPGRFEAVKLADALRVETEESAKF